MGAALQASVEMAKLKVEKEVLREKFSIVSADAEVRDAELMELRNILDELQKAKTIDKESSDRLKRETLNNWPMLFNQF